MKNNPSRVKDAGDKMPDWLVYLQNKEEKENVEETKGAPSAKANSKGDSESSKQKRFVLNKVSKAV